MTLRKKFISKKSIFSSFMLILMLGVALLFLSCDNLFENEVPEENQNEYLAGAGETEFEPDPIEISGQLIFNGAVPKELIYNEENNDSSRAAIPNFTSSEVDYFAVATSGTGANAKTMNGTFGTAGSANASTFSILLIPGRTWTITCGIKVKNSTDASDRLLTAVLPNVNPSEIASGTTLKFFPVPDTTDTSATGQIALSMSIDASITSVSLAANNEYSTGWPSSLNSATITPGSTTATINASVPVGTYEILMSFFDTDNNLLYASVQNITVCKGLTTRTWISSGGDSPINSSGVFSVTAAKIQAYTSTNFYVGDTGAANAVPASNDNSGSHKAPFLTFDKALSVVQSLAGASGADTTREYTIHICGTVDNSETTTVPEIGSGLNGNMAKLIIKGRANTTNPPVLQNPNTTGRVLNIETTVPVEIEGLKITGGNADGSTGPDGYGGGLYLSGNNTDVTLNNSVIEANQATIQGGGLYIASGAKLTMKGSSAEIKDNEVTRIVSIGAAATPDAKTCGGGIFVAEGGTLQIDNGTVSGNVTTDAGGGIYVRGDFTLNKGTITSNKRVNGTDGFGPDPKTSNIEMGTPGHFIMNGGTITSTIGYGWNGAAVNIYLTNNDPTGTATFDMNGGSITGLYFRSGAVKMRGYAGNRNVVFNMNGGSITGNHATDVTDISDGYGGAVYIGSYSEVNMTGGEISGNEAAKLGGAVYINGGSVTLGKSGSTSTVKIKNNTSGTSNAVDNVHLTTNQTITIAGALSTNSEVGLTRTYSTDPITSGFASTNSGTTPADIFTSDQGFDVIASTQTGSVGEVAFHMDATDGNIYLPGDYNFTLTALQNRITVGEDANVRVGLTVTRNEPSSGSTPTRLYYNASDHRLYTDATFTSPAGGTNEVTLSASLLFNSTVLQNSLTSGDGIDGNLFTIPAISFEGNYTLYVTATYMGYTHDASLPLLCDEEGPVPEGMVTVTGTTYDSSAPITNSRVFISGRNIGQIRNLIACDHEVTQGEYEMYMRYYDSYYTPTSSYGVGQNYPAYYVSWYEAVIYCNLRSLAEGFTPAYYLADSTGAEIGGAGKGRNIDSWLNSVVTDTKIIKNASSGKYYYNSTNINDKLDWNVSSGSTDSTGGIRFDTEANGWRLPTEIEWEYLARSGNLNPDTQTTYSGTSLTGNNINNVAWYTYNSGHKIHEVRTDKTAGVNSANVLGLYDMSGNVREWCWDWYTGTLDTSTSVTGPDYNTYSKRVTRGGSYNSGATGCQIANAQDTYVSYRYEYYGFRIVRNAE